MDAEFEQLVRLLFSWQSGTSQNRTPPQGCPGIRLYTLERGGHCVDVGDPISSIQIMLRGHCHILSLSQEGQCFVAYANQGFQIYGLTELLSGKDTFSASITAVAPCLFAAVDAAAFCRLLAGDLVLSGQVLSYLARLVEQAMESSVQRHFISGYELLLFDLYRQARGQSLPYRIRETRTALAQRLNLNLRTLYRYTQQLVLGGYARRVHGKLEIDRSAFRRLETQAVQIAGRF